LPNREFVAPRGWETNVREYTEEESQAIVEQAQENSAWKLPFHGYYRMWNFLYTGHILPDKEPVDSPPSAAQVQPELKRKTTLLIMERGEKSLSSRSKRHEEGDEFDDGDVPAARANRPQSARAWAGGESKQDLGALFMSTRDVGALIGPLDKVRPLEEEPQRELEPEEVEREESSMQHPLESDDEPEGLPNAVDEAHPIAAVLSPRHQRKIILKVVQRKRVLSTEMDPEEVVTTATEAQPAAIKKKPSIAVVRRGSPTESTDLLSPTSEEQARRRAQITVVAARERRSAADVQIIQESSQEHSRNVVAASALPTSPPSPQERLQGLQAADPVLGKKKKKGSVKVVTKGRALEPSSGLTSVYELQETPASPRSATELDSVSVTNAQASPVVNVARRVESSRPRLSLLRRQMACWGSPRRCTVAAPRRSAWYRSARA
jgi:hypothetical protein